MTTTNETVINGGDCLRHRELKDRGNTNRATIPSSREKPQAGGCAKVAVIFGVHINNTRTQDELRLGNW